MTKEDDKLIYEENGSQYATIKAVTLPDGYQFKDENGNVINATKIVLEKKRGYPKTYEECCNVLGYDDRETYCIFHTGANERLFEALYRLKVCRDAYWKIAGNWRPEFRFGKKKYCIMTKDNKVISATVEETNRIFVFQTEKMRDAFYENFKDLIESCKELL